MSWARHTAKARGRSPAKHTTASRWSLVSTTAWKRIVQSDTLVCERFPGTAARWLERPSTVLCEWLWRLGNHQGDCGSGGSAGCPLVGNSSGRLFIHFAFDFEWTQRHITAELGSRPGLCNNYWESRDAPLRPAALGSWTFRGPSFLMFPSAPCGAARDITQPFSTRRTAFPEAIALTFYGLELATCPLRDCINVEFP